MKKKNDIQQRIYDAPYGSSFIISDFTDIAEYKTAQKTLERLANQGEIRKTSWGLYDKPAYSELVHEYAAPDITSIATTIARNYNWTIVPSGIHALNILGLSTQVPYTYEYISDGPYRSYCIDGVSLKFYHRTNKEISGLSYKNALIIQAIKAIGKDKITDNDRMNISNLLTNDEKELLLKEARFTTAWIYKELKQICQ